MLCSKNWGTCRNMYPPPPRKKEKVHLIDHRLLLKKIKNLKEAKDLKDAGNLKDLKVEEEVEELVNR